MPLAGSVLAEWGAEVIKVEEPVSGGFVTSVVRAGNRYVDPAADEPMFDRAMTRAGSPT